MKIFFYIYARFYPCLMNKPEPFYCVSCHYHHQYIPLILDVPQRTTQCLNKTLFKYLAKPFFGALYSLLAIKPTCSPWQTSFLKKETPSNLFLLNYWFKMRERPKCVVENLLLHHQHDIHFEISALKVFYKMQNVVSSEQLFLTASVSGLSGLTAAHYRLMHTLMSF